MKILLAHHDALLTTVGGIEKVCVTLANGLHAAGHDVIVATHAETQGLPFFPLDQGVTFRNIYAAPPLPYLVPPKKYQGKNYYKRFVYRIKKALFIWKRVLAYGYQHKKTAYHLLQKEKAKQWKQCINAEKPDVIITMSMHAARELLYEQTQTVPLLHSINLRPDYDFTNTAVRRHSKILADTLKEPYKHFTSVQILFESFRPYLPETFSGKAYAIPNAVSQVLDRDIVKHTDDRDEFVITNISRLDCKAKQQDFAIKVFSLLAKKYPKWNLFFWGDGPDRHNLEILIKELGIENQVFLKGTTTKPLEELKKTDIFFFPSKYEGFGIALAEAMSVGLPAIGLTSCSGVNELIRDGENGFLVDTQEKCVQRLEELMVSAMLRQQLGENAHDYVKRFNTTDVINQWQTALEEQCSLGPLGINAGTSQES